ncbi:MAG: hypothetical protein JSV19_01400 [Phycisphaerales bacterium]|nr:MAG: hypothetical protein JSV19_01400 [Phycisphaerales bacterium]
MKPARRAPGLGLSAVELAAERGIGPLSPLVAEAWHGQSKPCPSCGQLIRRTASVCDLCGQDLSPQMILKMQAHCGPWYVLEHVRPFPGVALERLILQVRRGVLTPTTIVRGPTTYHQWRFAGETPGLSKYLGICWRCQASIVETDRFCRSCRANLDGETDVLFEQARPELVAGGAERATGSASTAVEPAPSGARGSHSGSATAPAGGPNELDRLTAALGLGGLRTARRAQPGSPKIVGIRVGWIVGLLVVVMIVVLCIVVWMRSRNPAASVQNDRQAAEVARVAG